VVHGVDDSVSQFEDGVFSASLLSESVLAAVV
jgi:hypothetical protein